MKKSTIITVALATLLALPLGFILANTYVNASAQSTAPVTAVVAASEPVSAPASAPYRYVTVLGQGKVRVKPDIASLNLGVETSNASVSDAMAENNEIMQAVMDALLAAGVEEKDIQTSSYNIFFDEGYRGPDMQQEPVYRVSNMLLVKVRDLDAVGDIIDSIVAAGANRLYGINFTLEDWTSAEGDARAKAMADANERALELAALAGVELGEVLNVSEVIGSPYYTGMEMAMMPVASSGMGGGGSAIAPGELQYSTAIQVNYALK